MDDFFHLFERQRSSLKALGKSLALDMFHYEIDHTVLPTNVEKRTIVRMVQARSRLGFAFEALLPNARKISVQNLDGHSAFKPRILRAYSSLPAPSGARIS